MDKERKNIFNEIELYYNKLYNFTINYGKNVLNDIQFEFYSRLKNLQKLRNNENYNEGISKLDNEGLIIYRNMLFDLLSNIENKILIDIMPQNNKTEGIEEKKYHIIEIKDDEDKIISDGYSNPRNRLSLNEAHAIIRNLRTQPIPREVQLSVNSIMRRISAGWINITNDQQRRNEIALDLKQKTFAEDTRDYWIVYVIPSYIPPFIVERDRTLEEGSNLNADESTPVGPVQNIVSYNGYIFQVFIRDSDTNSPATSNPIRQYYDVDGNGRIDFER